MGRWLVKITLVAGLALGGWWWLATSAMQQGVTAWLEANRAQGIVAEVAQMTRSGFPLRIGMGLEGTKLSDPAAGTAVTVPQISLSSPIYWPGDATLRLPAAQVTFTMPQGDAILTHEGIEAAMEVHPGTRLQLEAANITGTGLALDLAEGRILSLTALRADIAQGGTAETYFIDLTATGLALGSIVQQALRLPPGAPAEFAPVIADMTVRFDRPWDRSALRSSRPQPREILIDGIEIVYGDLGLLMTGDLVVDAQGIPTGTLGLELRSWQQMFDLAVAAGTIRPDWARSAQNMLRLMSDENGTLDLEITMAQGQMRMGFVTLGPAPVIRIP